MDPNIGPDLRAHIVLSCCYLQQFSKVKHFKMGLHSGTILGASLGSKLNKTWAQRKPKKECGKKTPAQKFDYLSERLEAPRQPPLARPGLNKKQQFEQQQQQQQQQLQPLLLDADSVVIFCCVLYNICKTTCCSLQNPKACDLTRPGQGPANLKYSQVRRCLVGISTWAMHGFEDEL